MRYVWVGAVVAVALGLALSGGLIFDESVQVRYQDNYDAVWSTTACQKADLATALGWWVRPWLPEHYLFYRPLYSQLMWVEAKLWGFSFFPYTIVSWVIHGVNCGLVFLLLYSVCAGPRWQRWGVAMFGVLMFSLGRYPSGAWGPEGQVALNIMPFWPAQTDLASLTGGLLALLCLDRYLLAERRRAAEPERRPDRRLLVAGCVAFMGGMLFKETALAVLVVAIGLAAYRRGNWRQIALWFGATALLFLAARALVLPQASNPHWQGWRSVSLWLQCTHRLSGELLSGKEIWEFVTLVTFIPLAIVLWRRRVSWVYLVLMGLIWPLLWGTVLTGNPAIATIKREMTILVRFAGIYGGLALAILTPYTEPLLAFISGVVLIGIANIERFGPHYWYWPVALWALIDGAALNALANSLRGWRQAERARQARQVDATAPDVPEI